MKLADFITVLVAPLFDNVDFLLGKILSLPSIFDLGLGYWLLLFMALGIIFGGVFHD